MSLLMIIFYLQGVKQITLLGQNVNSYRDSSSSSISFGADSRMVDGFSTVYGQKSGGRSVDLYGA